MSLNEQIPNQEASLSEESSPKFGLGRRDQLFVGVMLVLLTVLAAIYWAKASGWGRAGIEVVRQPEREYDFRVEINSASWVEWAQLEGIGEVLARRIVADRETDGPFADVDDLRRVNGIGAKKLDAIRRWLYVAPSSP